MSERNKQKLSVLKGLTRQVARLDQLEDEMRRCRSPEQGRALKVKARRVKHNVELGEMMLIALSSRR